MNKRVWLGFIVALIVLEALSFLVHGVLLSKDYEATSSVWRPEGEMKYSILIITNIIFSFFFAFIFSKGYERKGLAEGLRYGLYIGLMMALPAAYNTYAVLPVTYSFALKWFIYGTISYMIAGLVLAIVFKGGKGQAATA
jgi:uncharacterized membrane protein YagU involved in acid resistance